MAACCRKSNRTRQKNKRDSKVESNASPEIPDRGETSDIPGINTEIKVNGQRLETVTSFKYLGSVVTDEGSKPELLCRIAQATAALTRLNQFGWTRVFLSAPRYD